MALLQVENMTHYFGGLRAVHDFDLEIEPGQNDIIILAVTVCIDQMAH